MATVVANAQNSAPTKRPKKLNAKMQLAIEQAKVDSLNALVAELRQRESDWQKAWYDAQAERKNQPVRERFVEVTAGE